MAVAGFAIVCAVAIVACDRAHSAKWYMQHGEAMSAKVKQCQADAKRAAEDQDCRNALEAFVTWARATQQPGSAPEPAKR